MPLEMLLTHLIANSASQTSTTQLPLLNTATTTRGLRSVVQTLSLEREVPLPELRGFVSACLVSSGVKGMTYDLRGPRARILEAGPIWDYWMCETTKQGRMVAGATCRRLPEDVELSVCGQVRRNLRKPFLLPSALQSLTSFCPRAQCLAVRYCSRGQSHVSCHPSCYPLTPPSAHFPSFVCSASEGGLEATQTVLLQAELVTPKARLRLPLTPRLASPRVAFEIVMTPFSSSGPRMNERHGDETEDRDMSKSK